MTARLVFVLALTPALLLGGPAQADEVRLKNGNSVEGRIIQITGKEVVIRTPEGQTRVKREQVRLILRERRGKTILSLAKARSRVGDYEEAERLYRIAGRAKDPAVRKSAKRALKGFKKSKSRRSKARKKTKKRCKDCGADPKDPSTWPKNRGPEAHEADGYMHRALRENDAKRAYAISRCVKSREPECIKELNSLLERVASVGERDLDFQRPLHLRKTLLTAIEAVGDETSVAALTTILEERDDEAASYKGACRAMLAIWERTHTNAVRPALLSVTPVPDARDTRWTTRWNYYETVLDTLSKVVGIELPVRGRTPIDLRGCILYAHKMCANTPGVFLNEKPRKKRARKKARKRKEYPCRHDD